MHHVKTQVPWLERSDSNLKPLQQEVPLQPLGSSHVLLHYNHQPSVLTGTCLVIPNPSFPCHHSHYSNDVFLFLCRYYKSSVVLMCFVIPTVVPWYLWGESLWNAYFLASILRYTISLNVTWLVNSAAHMYGNRPYDKNINPRQNTFVTLGAIGRCCSPG